MSGIRRSVSTLSISSIAASVLISIGSVTAQEVACEPVSGSAALLRGGAVLLLGELHGTEQSPAFIGNLACQAVAAGLPLVVGLELAPSAQPSVDRFLASSGSSEDRRRLLADPLWQSGYQDGRTSRAIVALIDRLRSLRAEERQVEVVLFDASGAGGGQSRERGMAAHLVSSIEARPKAAHLVLTGNLHSRVARGSRGNSEYEPMGYLIARSVPGERVLSLDVGHAGGSSWICAPECGIAQISGRGEGVSGTIEIDEATRPSGHAGWYHVGRLTASPPASERYCHGRFDGQLPALDADYRGFDQTQGEGWRALSRDRCYREAAALIERYIETHDGLSGGELRILHFHAGQVLASDEAYHEAIPHFEQAIDPDEPEDASFRWNAYVRATLAFLRGDRDALLRQREIVARSSPRGGRVPNLDVVDRLIASPERSYRAAYDRPSTPTAKAPPRKVTSNASRKPAPGAEESAARWQGYWQAYEYGSKSWTIRIDGDGFHGVLGEDDWYDGTITLRPEAKPPEIDLLIEDCRCSYKGEASRAIFRWDGEAIILAAPQPGNPRPTVFDENSGQVVRLVRIEE